MSEIPLSVLLAVLFLLIIASGLFSGSETAMMASNRHKLRHKAEKGNHGAGLALRLLSQTDKLLGVILLCNTLINAAAATLTGYLALQIFGQSKWALEIGTICITFTLLIISEITPKVIAATYADRIVPVISYALVPLQRLLHPIVWFADLFVSALLRILGLASKPNIHDTKISPEELRSILVESAHFLPQQHISILTNLLGLNQVVVEDVMVPRGNIEFLDLDISWSELEGQISTRQHRRIPVCRGSLDQLEGVLLMRRLISELQHGELNKETLIGSLEEPYYIPEGTPVLAQMNFFKQERLRLGFVVDEYGEILGLVTLEDIIEEVVGEFTTSFAARPASLQWDKQGSVFVEGGRALREINRSLDLEFKLDGPKTLNGLILEALQDIPEAGISFRIDNVAIEIVQTEDRSVKTARLSMIK